MDERSFDALVVGSGAAGYSAACRIRELGKKTVALITEGVCRGTSRNTGSDKQTYYKLGLGGSSPDSVRRMAEDLFAGGSVDGDNALCEAALSARCFLRLCELGVPFPVNRYGEYVGYKTDHDPCARATSAGPLTSRFMTEVLERRAAELEVPVYDGLLAVEVLKDERGVCGLVCADSRGEYRVFRARAVVLATGGPGGIYADSVYPRGHTGSTGLALSAGAALQNAAEWQYGLASVDPRWNVSGTYMQVLPCFVSVDEAGKEREFLADCFEDPYEALSTVFLKGYQWPFDSRKVLSGSSVLDLLVYRERVLRGRRVFLDYRKNPFGLTELRWERLSGEAREYLRRAEACFGTPIQRLERMNRPAVDLYAGKGVDLRTQRLEIALCAQHHNGGIAVDLWWQTRVPGLYAVGECAGTHGVARPGGAALNAGQVGALRAAQHITAAERELPEPAAFAAAAEEALARHRSLPRGEDGAAIAAARRRMSRCGGAIRQPAAMKQALREIRAELPTAGSYKLRDLLLTQQAVLTAMVDFAERVGATRGSALYPDERGALRQGLEELFRFRLEEGETGGQVQEVHPENGGFSVVWRPVRPLPEEDAAFETVWRQYRETGSVF